MKNVLIYGIVKMHRQHEAQTVRNSITRYSLPARRIQIGNADWKFGFLIQAPTLNQVVK